jgi:hypothetical protein
MAQTVRKPHFPCPLTQRRSMHGKMSQEEGTLKTTTSGQAVRIDGHSFTASEPLFAAARLLAIPRRTLKRYHRRGPATGHCAAPSATPLAKPSEARSHEPSVALHYFAKISGAFLVIWAALLGRRFCPARVAVRAVRPSCAEQHFGLPLLS